PIAAAQKLKKETGLPQIQLETTVDILAAVAERKAGTGFPKRTIGFAAESQDLLENAKSKLERKRLDMIVANDIAATDAGFEVDTNRVVLLYPDGRQQALPVQEKSAIAGVIIQQLIDWG
ncbi:bifunctional 4'-phosphopantothenoylcysteine decarboxylase/phosphopantothenoylcysteine synthetase, partial [bacterium]